MSFHLLTLLSTTTAGILITYFIARSIQRITDHKQTERNLKQALQQINTHFEDSPLAILQWDKNFRILRWSKQAELMFGWTAEEVKSLSWKEWDFIYVEDRDRVTIDLAPLVNGLITNQAVQNRNYTKDGRVILCQWYSSAVFDESGDLVSVLSFAQDITELKQAEEALRDSEERFRRAFDDAAIGMALVGLDGQFLKVSRSFCELLGYSETELLSATFHAITHPDDLKIDQNFQQQMLTGERRTYQQEKRYIHRQGHIVWVLLNVSLVRDREANPLYFVSQVQDISDRHKIDRLKDEFISIVSHELRTPLTAIRGSLGILETGILNQDSETASRMLQVALRNSERLVRLVNDILDLERLESGKAQLVMEACDVDDLLKHAIESVQSIALQAEIAIELTSLSAQIWVAPDAIIQTLTNLLGNAIKFSPQGSTIWLTAGLGQGNGYNKDNLQGSSHPFNYVLFSIQDQGRGIPPEKLENIFGRFQQVDVSDSRQKGGTGLGLAICKSIVQQHGGQIWAESQPGKGSKFYFTIPQSHQDTRTEAF